MALFHSLFGTEGAARMRGACILHRILDLALENWSYRFLFLLRLHKTCFEFILIMIFGEIANFSVLSFPILFFLIIDLFSQLFSGFFPFFIFECLKILIYIFQCFNFRFFKYFYSNFQIFKFLC